MFADPVCHEWWARSGCAAGLVGKAIAQATRIVGLTDVYNAIAQFRPPKQVSSHDDVMTYI
jgi:HD-GYP domain-containing protein (c-di-GMP phosphodiesterase class II)